MRQPLWENMCKTHKNKSLLLIELNNYTCVENDKAFGYQKNLIQLSEEV